MTDIKLNKALNLLWGSLYCGSGLTSQNSLHVFHDRLYLLVPSFGLLVLSWSVAHRPAVGHFVSLQNPSKSLFSVAICSQWLYSPKCSLYSSGHSLFKFSQSDLQTVRSTIFSLSMGKHGGANSAQNIFFSVEEQPEWFPSL